MNTQSVWVGTSQPVQFPSLAQDMEVDVAIVGGGITGITAAMLLSAAEKNVVVLEAMNVGLGTTGHSTGNLYATIDENLYRIRDKWDQKTATAVVRSRHKAMDLIDRIVGDYRISCSFARRPHYIFPTSASQVQQMHREYEVIRSTGLGAAIFYDIPLPFHVDQALKIEGQAQFHPLAYVRGLAQGISSSSCRIFEGSQVVEIDNERMTVHTARGRVRARKIIMATHTPKGINVLQTALGPYREYGLALRLKQGPYPEGIFWSFGDPGHSIRSYDVNGAPYLIVIGEQHKVGQQEHHVDYYQNLEEYARSHFDVDRVEYRWSAQNYQPADILPYIGQSLGAADIYVATGFGTDGLIYGTLAAWIITDDIVGRENPWRDLYSARRFTPAKSALEFLKENLDVAGQYARGRLGRAGMEDVQDIQPGQGGVVEVNGERLALYRGEDGQWAGLSPVCTHLGCRVHWNAMEKSWDCPCHGSRFQRDGQVIEGPALKALKEKRVEVTMAAGR